MTTWDNIAAGATSWGEIDGKTVLNSHTTSDTGSALNHLASEMGQLAYISTGALVTDLAFNLSRTDVGANAVLQGHIYDSSATGLISSTAIASSTNTIDAATLSGSVRTFFFNRFEISEGTYGFVMSRSTATTTANAPVMGVDSNNPHAGIRILRLDSGSWTSTPTSLDVYFTVLGVTTSWGDVT